MLLHLSGNRRKWAKGKLTNPPRYRRVPASRVTATPA